MSPAFLTLCVFIAASDEVAATRLTAGATPEAESGEPSDVGAALFDNSPGWRYEPRTAQNPPVVVKLGDVFDLTRIEIANVSDEREFLGMSTKTLRVEAAPARGGPWGKILEATLKKGGAAQRFPVKAPATRYLRITLLTNFGSMQRFGLDEFTAFGKRSKPPAKFDFTGAWDTNQGEMRLEQKGKKVTGCYGPAGGMGGDSTISGTVEGGALVGTWRDDKSALSGGVQTGAIGFSLTGEGDISGIWGVELRGEGISPWLGKKKSKATVDCTPSQKVVQKNEKTTRPVNDLDAELQEHGRVTLRGLLFRTGSDVILPESTPVLSALADSLKGHPTVKAVIEGHTDNVGSPDVNQKLSERRATSVKTWLVKKGVATERLSTKGFGQESPTRSNDTEAGRAQNRRVEVAIVK